MGWQMEPRWGWQKERRWDCQLDLLLVENWAEHLDWHLVQHWG